MKILLCTPYFGPVGGISLWAKRLYKYYQNLSPKDLSIEIFSLSRSKPIHANTPILKRFAFGIFDYFYFFVRFVFRLIGKDFQVIHLVSSGSFGLIKDIVFLVISKIFLKKSILHFRFGRIPDLFLKKNWEYFLLKVAISLANSVIVIDSKSYRSLKGFGLSNINYVPNPIDDSVIEFVAKNQFVRTSTTILFAGHVVPTKGIFELVEATKDFNQIRVCFLGYCSEDVKESILRLTSNDSKYIFLGERSYSDTLREMMNCGIFVLPSYTEGFPNVILESMACACPIISTNVGAIPDMLSDFLNMKTGVCIPPKDATTLKQEIQNVLNNYCDALEMGKNAQKKVSFEYSMEKIWEELKHVWYNI